MIQVCSIYFPNNSGHPWRTRDTRCVLGLPTQCCGNFFVICISLTLSTAVATDTSNSITCNVSVVHRSFHLPCISYILSKCHKYCTLHFLHSLSKCHKYCTLHFLHSLSKCHKYCTLHFLHSLTKCHKYCTLHFLHSLSKCHKYCTLHFLHSVNATNAAPCISYIL